MKKIFLLVIFFSALNFFSSCKKDEDDTTPDPRTPTPTTVSGKISRMDVDSVRKFEVIYNSSNVPVSLHHYDASGTFYGITALVYNTNNLLWRFYGLAEDSTGSGNYTELFYDVLNRVIKIEWDAPSIPWAERYIISYSGDNASRVDYFYSPSFTFAYYFTINYMNDSTQDYVFHDAAGNACGNITTVFDKKVNPLFPISSHNPEYDFKQNIRRQSSPQMDSNGEININIGTYTYSGYAERNNTYQYSGNYPTQQIREWWNTFLPNDTITYFYK